MSSTQETNNPIADLIANLGMNEESTVDDNSTEENLSLDSDTATKEDAGMSETSNETDTPEGDTETSDDIDYKSEFEKMQQEIDTYKKRMSDKDKYINELKNQKKDEWSGDEEQPQQEEDDFWDNPEGAVKTLKREVLNLRNELAEQRYAATKSDYWDFVKADDIKDALEKDATFTSGLQETGNPYEYAYNYFKSKQEASKAKDASYREKIRNEERQKILEEMKKGNNKETIPSINKVGSNSGSSNKSIDEDGFASYFGTQY